MKTSPSDFPQGNDNINHPPHYTRGKYECIDIIEDIDLGYHLGNAFKYMYRAGHKDASKEIEDLKKAVWFIERKISTLQEQVGEESSRDVGFGVDVRGPDRPVPVPTEVHTGLHPGGMLAGNKR